MNGKLSIARIASGTLALTIVLIGLFVILTYYRMSTLQNSGLGACLSELNANTPDCASFSVFQYLWHPQWIAAQFSCYFFAAMIIGYLFTRKNPKTAPITSALIGVISAALLLSIIEPGRLSALSAFLGVVLGGLIASPRSTKGHKIQDRRK